MNTPSSHENNQLVDALWQHQFELIHKLVSERIPTGRQGKFSPVAAEKFLGVTPKKWNAWARGQRPNARDLEIIGRVLGLNPHWLLFGEGIPFAPKTDTEGHVPTANKSIPATYRIAPIGDPSFLAEPEATQETLVQVLTMMGNQGAWAQPASGGLRHPLPHIAAHWLAVQASDNTYAPIGFFMGNIAYCNPHALPRREEALFVQRKDGSASIRLWLGYADSQHICLRGCTPQPEQAFFEETIEASTVRCLAPVILIQRRI